MVARDVGGELGSPSYLLFRIGRLAVRSRFSTRCIRGLGAAKYGVASGYPLVLRPEVIDFAVGGWPVIVWGRGCCLVRHCEGLLVYL